MKYKRAKIFLLLFVFCIIAYFSNDFQLINIEKTAIIVAIGIDKTQDKQLEVTAQIAVPQASNQNESNSDAILSAKDKTLYGALEKLSLQTGWYPKLTFCNLILLGNSLTQENFTPIIDYVLTSNRFQNSAVIATCEKDAKETLKSATPLDNISSFALQKILLRNLDRSSSVLVSDVRQFCSLSRSRSQFFYTPLIKHVQTTDKPKGESAQAYNENGINSERNPTFLASASGDGSGSSASGEGGGQGKGGQGGENNSVVFDASQTLFFSKNKPVCILNKEQTHCYNLITKSVRESFIPVKLSRGGNQIDALISIVSNRPKIKIKTDKTAVNVEIKVTLICEKEETFENENLNQLSNYSKVSNEGLLALEETLTKTIDQLIKLSVENDCDFLQIKELLYRHAPHDYLKFKDNLLQKCIFKVSVVCKNYR